MLDSFTASTFAELVGSSFALLTDGAEFELKLVEVTEAAAGEARAAAGLRDPFSIRFVGPGDPPLAQRTYPLRHDALGSFELFLVPIARDRDGTSYEAVFA